MKTNTLNDFEEYLTDLEIKLDDLISKHQTLSIDTTREEREKQLAIVKVLTDLKKEVI